MAFVLIGYFGVWDNAMRIITVSTLLSISLGVPIGILMSRSNRGLAIIFDRVSQAYAKRSQRHLQGIQND